MSPQIKVNSSKCSYENGSLLTKYTYENSTVTKSENGYTVEPTAADYQFKVDLAVPKLGVLAVGLGGNNGTTLAASIIANRDDIAFENKEGTIPPSYFGSVTQCSTVKIGIDSNGKDVYAPFNSLLPFVNPNDIVIGGWDISSMNLSDAMKRAQVLDYGLQVKLEKKMEAIRPMQSLYYPDFIAANQKERADNCFNQLESGSFSTNDKWSHVQKIRDDIAQFKAKEKLDKVIVIWTANTERYAQLEKGVNDTADNLINSIKADHKEVSASTIFAVACILDGVPFVNGSPQNTFVPGCVELAEKHGSFIGGDDFKSGQTKVKSILAQFLVDAGIRPVSIASYNHLGNNDGYNLSAPDQFRSKEISKASVVDDVIESNSILYNEKLGKSIDHCIVIKHVPAVGDSKVAMDEYYSQLMLGGHNRISIHNVCEDSLLATPLIIDLVVMTEFFSRVSYKKLEGTEEYEKLHSVLAFLSYWLKAPLTRQGCDPVNGLNKQRLGLENLLRLLVGLPVLNELKFEERL